MSFETTATRLWKRLAREERLAAATCFWREPPQETIASALGAIIKARRLRPQVARSLPPEEHARILASVLDPGEPLASSLLVALHVGERRAMLATFLDALHLPHENGILKDEAFSQPSPSEETARAGVAALAAAFPREQVLTYLNTLWLQDPERWAALKKAPEWL